MLDGLTVIIKGKHDTGKSTLANLLKMYLEENGYKHVTVQDLPPLPQEQKAAFYDRFSRNRDLRPVTIKVELIP